MPDLLDLPDGDAPPAKPLDAFFEAVKARKSVLIEGTELTEPLLAAAAALLAAPGTRIVQAAPPLDLYSFTDQVGRAVPPSRLGARERAIVALTVLGDGCNRIVLLVADADQLQRPTLLRLAQLLETAPHLQLVLAGKPGLAGLLAQDGLDTLRRHVEVEIALPSAQPAATPPLSAYERPLPTVRRRSPVLRLAVLAGIAAVAAAALAGPKWFRGEPLPFAALFAGHETPGQAEPSPNPAPSQLASGSSKEASPTQAAPPPAAVAQAALPPPAAPVPPEQPARPDRTLALSAAPATAPADPAIAIMPSAPAAAAPAPASTPPARPAATLHTLEPALVALPGGEFRMGGGRDATERPAHTARVAPFLLAAQAVTVREWQQCVGAGACQPAGAGLPDEPVTNVSWDDANAYAAWLSKATAHPYRLPTEAEWEYAARAGATTRYAWGDAVVPGLASCKGCGTEANLKAPPRVDAYPPNAFGLYAMGGGAAEWVADCWHQTYQGAPSDGSAAWNGPDCRERVMRGGAWMDNAAAISVSARTFYDASVRYPTHGFRLAQSK